MKTKITIILSATLLMYLFFWPVPIEPVAWQAPQAPKLEGVYASNDRLASIKTLALGEGKGPETVITDAQGNLFTGYADGRVVRFDAEGNNPKTLVNTGGRPLGLAFAPNEMLIVADGYKGLLSVHPDSGQTTVLATEAEGVPFGFTDDVDVSAEGKVYFSDASSKFGPAGLGRDDILEHGGNGRLLEYDLATGEIKVLLKDLEFANGVALSKQQDFVVVNQTGSYNIVRYWLRGEKAGQSDIFFENLPGLPDGISYNGQGIYWVALYSPRVPILDMLSNWPALRKISLRLPQILQPQPARHAFVLGINDEGKVIHNLQFKGPNALAPITGTYQHGNKLYLGSLIEERFGVLEL